MKSRQEGAFRNPPSLCLGVRGPASRYCVASQVVYMCMHMHMLHVAREIQSSILSYRLVMSRHSHTTFRESSVTRLTSVNRSTDSSSG